MSTPLYFFDVSAVEKLLSGLSPHTFLTPVPSTMLLRQGVFYTIFLTIESKHIHQNVKMYSASVRSL